MAATSTDVCKTILAIFLPPPGLIKLGCGAGVFINICLTIMGYIPGIIHALYIILRYWAGSERCVRWHSFCYRQLYFRALRMCKSTSWYKWDLASAREASNSSDILTRMTRDSQTGCSAMKWMMFEAPIPCRYFVNIGSRRYFLNIGSTAKSPSYTWNV